ncbi:MAG: helix-turn-helix transcriptional regulator [Acidobacteria bacterium]|nr:helix-turn-helix transcriptional regulator [Acidobacteriota bacterium]
MRLYLDACCLNRPFDDQRQDRVRLEAEAVVLILGHIASGEWELVDSEVVQFEIEQAPSSERRERVGELTRVARRLVRVGEAEAARVAAHLVSRLKAASTPRGEPCIVDTGGERTVSAGSKTLDEIRRTGLGALARELGPVGMIRFLQQFQTGSGDYSVDRHSWLEKSDVRSLAKKIGQRRRDLNRGRRGEATLSGREKEILAFVIEGVTNREIARKLSISQDAVRLHLRRIFDKIGVKDRPQAAECTAKQNVQPRRARLGRNSPVPANH